MINPKPFTAMKTILEVMEKCHQTGEKINITHLKNGKGEPINRASMSPMINKLAKANFEPRTFYTETCKETDDLFIGCYKPKVWMAQ